MVVKDEPVAPMVPVIEPARPAKDTVIAPPVEEVVAPAAQSAVPDQKKTQQPEKPKQVISEQAAYTDVELGKVYKVEGFYFGFNRTSVYSGETKRLNELYKLLKNQPHLKVQIQAYTDCRGNANVNKRVAMQRAASYKRYLEKKGINSSRIACKWFGTRDPEISCTPCNSCSEEDHKRNRRIEFKIAAL